MSQSIEAVSCRYVFEGDDSAFAWGFGYGSKNAQQNDDARKCACRNSSMQGIQRTLHLREGHFSGSRGGWREVTRVIPLKYASVLFPSPPPGSGPSNPTERFGERRHVPWVPNTQKCVCGRAPSAGNVSGGCKRFISVKRNLNLKQMWLF